MSALIASLDNLRKSHNLCARLSIWHTRAYFVGVQTALQLLDVDSAQDILELEKFTAKLRAKFGVFGTEYDAVWCQTISPRDSADVFLHEWELFRIGAKEDFGERLHGKADALIDLTIKLPSIEAKPHFYFATADVLHLKAWFEGVGFVAQYCGGLRIEPDIEAFGKWLRIQALSNPSCPWEMILTSMCGGDIGLAFTKFFEELRHFKN